jgi:hypothetical protein
MLVRSTRAGRGPGRHRLARRDRPLLITAGVLVLAASTLAAGDTAGRSPAAPWRPGAARSLAGWTSGAGPVLVLTGRDNGFTRYLPEILGSEGFGGEFAVADAAGLGSSVPLGGYSRIVLADTAVPPAGVRALTAWTRAGGTLIAMHPTGDLAPLFGLGPRVRRISDGYLRLTDPGLRSAIYGAAMRYHGEADARPLLPGARALALLYPSATVATRFPAISSRRVGDRGGRAVAFAYGLSRSVVYTRQGNPAWAGQNRDPVPGPDGVPRCRPDCLTRSDDLFAGDPAGPGDWIDLRRNQVPHADLQQRILANLLELPSPLPRLWYLPTYQPAPDGLLAAAVVLTGDDHNSDSQTLRRFTAELGDARQPAGCGQPGTVPDRAVIASWRCIRSTSYAYGGSTTDAAAREFDALGFEVAPHVSDRGECPAAWRTPAELDARIFGPDIRAWTGWYRTATAAYPPLTERIHCVQWNDWLGTAKVEASYGIALDTNYYQWPQTLFGAHPGLMTGSGLPQHFADAGGEPIPVWQATTQITDETPATNTPTFIRGLLRNATGPRGWFGVFTANEHLDNLPESNRGAAVVTDAALAAGVPVISAGQLGAWETARAKAASTGVTLAGSALTWSLTRPPPHAMQLVPVRWGGRSLRSVSVDGRDLAFTTRKINGIAYALTADAPGGGYEAVYG